MTTTTDRTTRRFPRVAVPLAVVAAVVVALQLGLELSIATEGPARTEDAGTTTARLVRLGGAALLSVASLLLAVGIRADRELLQQQDDRVAGEYLAAGLVTALVCAFTGALPGLLVAVAVVLAIPVLRRHTPHPRGTVARDVQNLAFVLVGVHVLLLGLRETFAAWVHWSRGYGIDDARMEALVTEHHGDVVLSVLLVPAVALTLLLPLLLWRHRAAIRTARGTLVLACVAVAVITAVGANYAGSVVALACLAAVAVVGRGGAPARS